MPSWSADPQEIRHHSVTCPPGPLSELYTGRGGRVVDGSDTVRVLNLPEKHRSKKSQMTQERMAVVDVVCKAREAEVDFPREAMNPRILGTKPSLEASG